MKKLAPILFILALVLVLGYFYWKEKNKPTEEQTRSNIFNSIANTKTRLSLSAFKKYTLDNRRTEVPNDYFSCPLDSEIWISTKGINDQVNEANTNRKAYVKKSENGTLELVGIADAFLLNNVENISDYNVTAVNFSEANYVPDALNANVAIKDFRGWLWLISSEMLKLVCVKKGQKVL